MQNNPKYAPTKTKSVLIKKPTKIVLKLRSWRNQAILKWRQQSLSTNPSAVDETRKFINSGQERKRTTNLELNETLAWHFSWGLRAIACAANAWSTFGHSSKYAKRQFIRCRHQLYQRFKSKIIGRGPAAVPISDAQSTVLKSIYIYRTRHHRNIRPLATQKGSNHWLGWPWSRATQPSKEDDHF